MMLFTGSDRLSKPSVFDVRVLEADAADEAQAIPDDRRVDHPVERGDLLVRRRSVLVAAAVELERTVRSEKFGGTNKLSGWLGEIEALRVLARDAKHLIRNVRSRSV